MLLAFRLERENSFRMVDGVFVSLEKDVVASYFDDLGGTRFDEAVCDFGPSAVLFVITADDVENSLEDDMKKRGAVRFETLKDEVVFDGGLYTRLHIYSDGTFAVWMSDDEDAEYMTARVGMDVFDTELLGVVFMVKLVYP